MWTQLGQTILRFLLINLATQVGRWVYSKLRREAYRVEQEESNLDEIEVRPIDETGADQEL